MIVSEVTHHGDFRHVREVTLPDDANHLDVADMLATCAYPYTNVAFERLDKVHADLTTVGRAEHGWTTWTVKPEPEPERDPTAPLAERTPEELADFLDTHVLYALEAADLLSSDRQTAEDLVRDRLVALADTYQSPEAVHAESARRRMDRLRRVIGL